MTDQKQIHRRSEDRLLLLNLPIDCDIEFLKHWVESRGYRVYGVQLIRDLVSGTSPSFAQVQLMDSSKLDEAQRALDGLHLRANCIRARRIIVPLPDDQRSSAGNVA